MSTARWFDIVIITFGAQIQNFNRDVRCARVDSLLLAWSPPFNLPDGLKSNSNRPAFSTAAAVAAPVPLHTLSFSLSPSPPPHSALSTTLPVLDNLRQRLLSSFIYTKRTFPTKAISKAAPASTQM